MRCMGRAVPVAFGELGGSCEELLAALMEDVAPTQLFARCTATCGTPVLPMEAVPASDVAEVVATMSGLEAVVERRYVGKRVQIHRLGDCIAIYDNDQQDLGSLLRKEHLDAMKEALGSKACIVDAVAVSASSLGAESDGVFFTAFDCLWLNGSPLTRRSLSERHEALRRIVFPCEFLQVAPQERFCPHRPLLAEDAAALLEEAKAASCPGLVFKSLSSSYEAGHTSTAWVTLDA